MKKAHLKNVLTGNKFVSAGSKELCIKKRKKNQSPH